MEISCTILAASVLIYCIHSKYSLLTLMHSLKVLSFDTDAVLQASKSVGKCLPVVFFGDCFQLWNHHFGKVLDTISFPSVSCLARKKRAKLKGASQDCMVDGERIIFFFLSITLPSYSPLYCGDWHCCGEGRCSGGGDWMLAADLLSNFK